MSVDCYRDFDHGAAVALYRQLPSLREYLLVAQDRVSVEIYTPGDEGRWILRAYEDLGATVHLPSIGCELKVSEIYDGIDFPAAHR